MDVLTAIVKDDVRGVQEKAGINRLLLRRYGRNLKANMKRSSKS